MTKQPIFAYSETVKNAPLGNMRRCGEQQEEGTRRGSEKSSGGLLPGNAKKRKKMTQAELAEKDSCDG